MIQAFKKLFATIPYDHFLQTHAIEALFASNIYTALKILGVHHQVEVHTNQGRIDAVIQGKNCVFIAEFKMGTAQQAMTQILKTNYAQQFAGGNKKVFLVAVGFSEEERNIKEYEIREG